MYPTLRMFIDGETITDRDGEAVYDPSSEQEIAHLPHANAADIEAAADTARRAFARWRDTSPYVRSMILRRAASLIRDRAAQIAETMTREQGKTIGEAAREVAHAADVFDWYAEEGRRAYGRVVAGRNQLVEHLVLSEPVGPSAVFTPWNFPALTPARKLGAGLAAGCTLVLKAAEATPGTAVEIVQALHDAGLPPGTVNLVFGNPAEISEGLIAHKAIRKISFTGSTAVGRKLMQLAAAAGKRTTMELGGNAPVIICQDAEIAPAADLLASFKFSNAGQICVAPNRFFVHEARHEEFVAALSDRMSKIVIGNGLDGRTTMGPLVGPSRVSAMHDLLTDAEGRQAQIVRCAAPQITGNFVPPTIVTGIGDDASLMQNEIFGPIVPVSTFSRDDEAIARANAVEGGLAGYIFTSSPRSAHELERALEVGMVGVNSVAISSPELPFGGIRESGHGHESGPEGLHAYLATKTVTRAWP